MDGAIVSATAPPANRRGQISLRLRRARPGPDVQVTIAVRDQLGLGAVTHKEEAVVAVRPPIAADLVAEHRLSGPGLHLDEGAFARGGLFQDEIGVDLLPADARDPLPA